MRNRVRGNIHRRRRVSAYNHAVAYSHALVNHYAAAYENVFARVNVPREGGEAARDVIVANNAVVPDVRRRHHEGAFADFRRRFREGRPVHRRAFAYDGACADFDVGRHGAVEMQVLRFAADYRKRAYLAVFRDSRPAADPRVRLYHAAVAYLRAALYYCVRAHYDIFAEQDVFSQNCRGVYCAHISPRFPPLSRAFACIL